MRNARRGRGQHAERAPTRVALVAATALHALVIAAVVLVPIRRTTPQSPPEAAAIEVAIEVVPDAPTITGERAAPAASAEERSPPSTDERLQAHASEATRALDHEAPPSPEPAPNAGSPSPSPPVVLMMPASPPAIGLALGAPNAFASAGPATDERSARPSTATADRPVVARTAAEAKRAVETALREPARQRERELGLGPEGPVLQALGDATSASTAPVKGRAVFRAVADGTGMIVGIEVLECDGGRPGWANAAELARQALVGKKLRMPSTATRAEMRIEIVSEWKLPSGHDPGTDVSVLGLPVAKGEGKKSTKVDLLNPIPKIEMVELAKGVPIPVPQVNVTIVAVQGDPADIGAKPRRVVHTKLLDSKVL